MIRFPVSDYKLFFCAFLYDLSTDMVPVSFLYIHQDFSILLVNIKRNNFYFIFEQLQKVYSSAFRGNYLLIFTLLSFLHILTDVKQLSAKFSLFDVLGGNLIKLNKVFARFRLLVRLFIFYEQDKGFFQGLQQLKGDALVQKPERDDFMHPGKVVDLHSGIFVAHCDVSVVGGTDGLEEGGNTKVGVVVLGFSIQSDRIDISKFIRGKQFTVAFCQAFYLFGECGCGNRSDLRLQLRIDQSFLEIDEH